MAFNFKLTWLTRLKRESYHFHNIPEYVHIHNKSLLIIWKSNHSKKVHLAQFEQVL